jgi:hypothetical protein
MWLALQLRLLIEMGLSGGGLVSASPERPSDDVGGFDGHVRQDGGIVRHCHGNRVWRAGRSWARIEE